MDTIPNKTAKNCMHDLFTTLTTLLGEKIVGFYIYGSLATGDFDETISDIDIVCAVSSDITLEEFETLKLMHDAFMQQHRAWTDRIDAQYVSTEGLKSFTHTKTPMVTISPGEPLHMIAAGSEWLVNWYMVQEYGIVVYGPAPSQLITHISLDEFIKEVKNHCFLWPEWITQMPKKRGSQAYAILTLCRAYVTVTQGKQVSKLMSAQLAKTTFPHWSALIHHAIQWRKKQWVNQTEDENTFQQTVGFVNCMVEKIRRM